MSNTLALATLTAVIEGRITALLNAAGLAGFDVVVDHPKGEEPDPGIYIKPYRVVPSAALRNSDLPTRRSEGSLLARPRLAIDVDLLITFVGEPGTYDPERLAGLVMTEFHANPSLGKQEIKDFLAGLPPDHVLDGADLGDQLARVRLTPLSLNLEDLSRVWGLYGLSVYGLSVAYQAGPLLLDAEVRPAAPMPVHATNFSVVPNVAPVILALRSTSSAQALGVLGDVLTVQGTGLRGPSTWLRIGEVTTEVANADVGTDRVTLLLDAGLGLQAGVRSIQVIHKAELGPPSDPWRIAAQSNAMPFALLPKINGVPSASGAGPVEVRVAVEPLPGPDQDVSLILDPLAGGTQQERTEFAIDGSELVFAFPTLAAGEYLLRVRIDGAVSQLVVGAGGTFDSPKVTVP
ncbi:MAG TPA: DUF4255 domain-containing protein [Enhygromyxa sp.]|nr:DUF4255 domain-containing protein [Enhygromyxa sp.]